MKWFGFLSLFIVIFTCFSACRQEQNKADTARLMRLDSLLTTHPGAVPDSLKNINTDLLNDYNNAYFYLLDIIAKDKNYFKFTSDSLITKAVDKLCEYSNKQPATYARSLMYQGIVRYRMHITDSTTYQPLKEANTIFGALTPPDLTNQYLCLYYLSQIHEKNNNIDQAKVYLTEAAQVAQQIGDTSYLYSVYSGIFWLDINRSDFKEAKHYLDLISRYMLSTDEYVISFKNMQSVYFERTGQYNKSLALEQQILQLKSKPEYKNTLITNYYNISKAYCKLNQPDSTLKYAALSVQAIRDTSYHLNYLYYLNLAQAACKSGDYRLSVYGYEKTYELLSHHLDKKLDTKILELEKKYNLTASENTTLRLRNRMIVLGAVVLLMLVVIIILVQHSVRQKQIKTLTEQRNKALESEKLLLHDKQLRLTAENSRNEQELIKTQLILSFFQQVSKQNLEIKKLLYDLKINTYIEGNKVVYNRISEEYNSFNRESKITETDMFIDDVLLKLTGITAEDARKLNKSERLLLLLLTLNTSNHEMAVLFNTSSDSIRNRKVKLKKKMEQAQIQLKKQLTYLI